MFKKSSKVGTDSVCNSSKLYKPSNENKLQKIKFPDRQRQSGLITPDL